MRSHDTSTLSRRRLLATAGGALTVTAGGVGTTGVAGASGDDGRNPEPTQRWGRRCPEATIRPSHEHCEGSTMAGCDDDHPETERLQAAVRAVLESRYPTVGDMVDDGFLPYFDTLDRSTDGWSHWLSPEYIGDDAVLDPDRPESILVDNETWRAIGVMFIATREGEPIEPPSVYGEDEPDEERCSPWHYHAGLPGRKAWWYYENVYEDEGWPSLRLPCRTPCMMHVWTVDHPDGVYAHGGPPAEYRDRTAAAESGLETDAVPGEDTLDWKALPDDVVPSVLPDDLEWP